MIRSFLTALWRRLAQFIAVASLTCLVALVLLRLGTWALLGEQRHADLQGPIDVRIWQVDHPAFGGLSALLMAPDGRQLIAGGDHGALITAEVARDPDGRINALTAEEVTLTQLRSGPAPEDFKMDLEALTRDPAGGWLLAYENQVRIERLAHPGALPRATHPWEAFVALFGNQAFEALATLPDGRVIAMTEGKDRATGQAGSMLWDGTTWQQGPQIPVSRGYRITGADVGPDGCLYLLERRYGLETGFRFGIRRLSGGPGNWADTLLYRAAPARLGNAEGIAAWQDAAGQIGLSVVTDDGFWPLTATRLIELRIRPGQGCGVAF